jgi:hypothetical protein
MRTFVVRVFVPAEANGVPLCGIVEHVGTGRAEQFHGSHGLVDAVLDELARDAEPANESQEEPPGGRRRD